MPDRNVVFTPNETRTHGSESQGPLDARSRATSAGAQPPQTGEEIRAQRIQRQQARYRDRGGIFVPSSKNNLGDILLGRAKPVSPVKWMITGVPNSPSPARKGRARATQGDEALPDFPSTGARGRRRSLPRKSLKATTPQEDPNPHTPITISSKAAARAKGRKSAVISKGRASIGKALQSKENEVDEVVAPSEQGSQDSVTAVNPTSDAVTPTSHSASASPKKSAARKSVGTQKAKTATKSIKRATSTPRSATSHTLQSKDDEDDDDDIPLVRVSKPKANPHIELEDEIPNNNPKQSKAKVKPTEEDASDDDIPISKIVKTKPKQRAAPVPKEKNKGDGKGRRKGKGEGKGKGKKQPASADAEPEAEPEAQPVAKTKPKLAAASRLSTIPESDSEDIVSAMKSPSPQLPLPPHSPPKPGSVNTKKRKLDSENESVVVNKKADTKRLAISKDDGQPQLPSKRSKISTSSTTIIEPEESYAHIHHQNAEDEGVEVEKPLLKAKGSKKLKAMTSADETPSTPAKKVKSTLKRTREEDEMAEEVEVERAPKNKKARNANKQAEVEMITEVARGDANLEPDAKPKNDSKKKTTKKGTKKEAARDGSSTKLATRSKALKENANLGKTTPSTGGKSKISTPTKKKKLPPRPSISARMKLTKSRAFKPPPRKPRKSVLERIRLHYDNIDEDSDEPDPIDCLS